MSQTIEELFSSPKDRCLSGLEGILNSKELHSLLPSLCSCLFGTKDLGYIHKYDWLQSFLSPQGRFFSTLTVSQFNSLLYGMNMDHLPAPTRKLIRDLDLDQLPSIYQGRVHYLDSKGQLQKVSPKNLSKESITGLKPVIKIMFNMFEYYIVSFAYSPILAGNFKAIENPLPILHSDSFTQVFRSSLSPSKNPINKDSALNSVFFTTLKDYLLFLLPTHLPRDEKENLYSRNSHLNASAPIMKPLDSIYSLKYLSFTFYTSRTLDGSKMASTAEFAIGAFLEFWLCQNDYHARNSDKEMMSFWVVFLFY